jgi:hypothetical protein
VPLWRRTMEPHREVARLFPFYVAAAEAEAQSVPRESIMYYCDVVAQRMVAGDAELDAATHIMPNFQ